MGCDNKVGEYCEKHKTIHKLQKPNKALQKEIDKGITVNVCEECNKDNWQYDLLEIKIGKKSVWLCPNCMKKLKVILNKFV